jgi:Fe2+ or Zn2+ uptake regulation protein
MRNTQARQCITEFLLKQKKPVTAKSIVDFVSKTRPDINKSTVYRFIKTLTEEGHLSTIQVPGRGAVYEMKAKSPHYHFTCNKCEEVICMGKESPKLKALVPRGFSVDQEDLVLSGTCSDCKKS